ncbi:MAG: hypothetical protein ACLQUT_12185 [Thermoleophilia bacterium]
MRLPSSLLSPRRLKGVAALAVVVLLAAAGTLIAACGGSSQAAAASGSTSKSTASSAPIQVLVKVTRGNLVDTIAASVKLKITNGVATGVAQISGQSAAQVASGQSVALSFINPSSFRLPTGTSSGQSSTSGNGSSSGSSGGSSAAPSTGSSQASPPGGGQGFFGQGGASAFRGKTAQGTVTSVAHNSNGSVTATIKIAKLPAGVTAKYVGIARINAGVLATNVIIIPTAAIKGSGSTATVEVLTNGSTSTRKVVVGKQTQAESEIVSGLAVGDNLIYMRTFQRGGGFRGGFGSGSGQGMFHQSGGQSTSGASGT